MIHSRVRLAGKAACSAVCVLACLAWLAPGFGRTWSDDSGKFSVEADLVSVENNEVTLKRADGKLIHLPIDKLSKADRAYLANKSGNSPATSPPVATPGFEPPATADSGDVPAASRVNAKRDAKQLAETEQAVNDLYKAELVSAKTPQQRSALARKMIHIGATESKPDVKYVLARKGAELAASAGNTQATFSGMNGVEAASDDPLPVWIDCLEILLAHNPDDLMPPNEKIDALISDVLAKNNFAAAAKLTSLSSAAARLSKDPAQITTAKAKAGEVAAAKDEAKKFAVAAEQLKANAADSAAKAVAGRFLCLVRRDWDHGLPLLNDSNDKVLQPIAAAELKPNKNPAELAALGDSWMAAAKKVPLHLAAQERGLYWYQQALPLASGLTKIKIEKELAAHQLKAGMDLLSQVDIVNDATGQWVLENRTLVGSAQGLSQAKISLPTPMDMNRYELTLDMTYGGSGSGVTIFIPVGERSVSVRLGPKPVSDGLELLDGVPGNLSRNPTYSHPGSLDPTQHCAAVIDVLVKGTDAEIQVETNKRKIISWKGHISQLDVYSSAPPHRERIGLSVGADRIVFYSIRLVYSKAVRAASDQNRVGRG